MTIKALEWAWGLDLPRSERDVLMVLANAINKDHEFAFPSQDTIAAKAKMSDRHVRRMIASLESRGLVRTMAGPGKGRGRAPTRYFLACDHLTGEPRELPMSDLTAGHERPAVTSQADTTGGHERPAVTSQADLTGGHGRPAVTSQADNHVRYIKKEPEDSSERKSITTTHVSGSLLPEPPAKELLDGRKAVLAFIAAAKECGWVAPKIEKLSAARKHAVRCCLKREGMEGWYAQIERAKRIAFLGGDSERGWRMNLDWFCKQANWVKIEEGYYDRRGRCARTVVNADAGEWERRLANYQHDRSWLPSYGPRPGEPGYQGPPLQGDSA